MPSDQIKYKRWGAILALLSFALVAAVSLLVAFQDQLGIHSTLLMTLQTNFYNDFIKADRYLLLVNGLLVTLQITVFSVIAGTIIGLCLALVKVLEGNGKYIFFLTRFTNIYLTVIRGTPAVVQLMIIYYGIFASVNIDKIFVAILAFSINSGAYVAEIIRAGILAVDRGQMEAARSLGMPYGTAMRTIILPQALVRMIPPLGNEFIALIKNSALVSLLTIHDVMHEGQKIISVSYRSLEVYLAIALIYFILTGATTLALRHIEQRLRAGGMVQ